MAIPRKILISRRNNVLYYKFGDNPEVKLIDTPPEDLDAPFGPNVTFGASINSKGVPFRYAKVYLSNIRVELFD